MKRRSSRLVVASLMPLFLFIAACNKAPAPSCVKLQACCNAATKDALMRVRGFVMHFADQK